MKKTIQLVQFGEKTKKGKPFCAITVAVKA